jgi:two-component system phosphate regulon sensor histidine kinase PhoR
LAWFAVFVLLALAIGSAIGHVGAALAVVFGGYACVSIWRLLRFDVWLRHRRRKDPPDFDGVWGDVVTTVSRIDRRKQFHKRRVVDLLREFRRLTAAMPDGAVLLNSENEIVWFNQRAASWLKLRRKIDLGFRIENLVRHPDFIDYLRRVEGGDADAEAPIIPMPGEANNWIVAYLVHTREAPQRLLVIRDVTHQVLLEAMRKEFVANASHELRSPLTVVSGYLDTLDDVHLDPSWRAPVGEMRRQAERMRAIIDDLLELSRLESRRDLASDEPVNVGGLLSVLRKDAMSLVQRPKSIVLRLDSTAKIRGSERELSSVFNNLVNNAVKYTPEDGEVEIRWWVDSEGGHVSVRDTGIGIAAEHLPRVTERFYRVDGGRSREKGGSGLGLAIVKHALQRHEARLEVQSDLGRGSTFTCHFPARRLV